MQPRINIITLGVKELTIATRFYEQGLGFPKLDFDGDISFFRLNGTWLALYPWNLLAKDATIDPKGIGFRGIALAHNVETENEVVRRQLSLPVGDNYLCRF